MTHIKIQQHPISPIPIGIPHTLQIPHKTRQLSNEHLTLLRGQTKLLSPIRIPPIPHYLSITHTII